MVILLDNKINNKIDNKNDWCSHNYCFIINKYVNV